MTAGRGQRRPGAGRRGRPWRLPAGIWWLDALYPIALAALLFSSLTYIVYAGQRQSRLAVAAEKRLMETSLSLAPPRVARPGATVTVTASVKDISIYGRAPHGTTPDLTIGAYAEAVGRLAAAGVPLIVLHLDAEAHGNDPGYLAPLTASLSGLPAGVRVFIVTATDAWEQLPGPLRQLAQRGDDGLCDEEERINTECTYLPGYPEWIVQAILSELGEARRTPEELPPWASTQLSSFLPRYILNLAPPAELPGLSVSGLLAAAPGTLDLGRARIALVGPDTSGAVSGRDETGISRRVLTLYDPRGINPKARGTPLHVFWGMIAQMYVDGSMVQVPPLWLSIAAVSLFCLLIVAVAVVFGAPLALSMFLGYVVTGPALNALGIRLFQVYVPLFDSYYFGLLTFMVTGLGGLSYTSVRRWRLEAAQRQYARTADLKSNFISLLSHNLNTPVAKMQGTLAMLAEHAEAGGHLPDINAAAAAAVRLELAIRAVLTTAALEEGQSHAVPRSVAWLRQDLASASAGPLQKLGLSLLVDEAFEDDEWEQVPLTLDARAIGAAVTALAALFEAGGSPRRLRAALFARSDTTAPADHEGGELVVAVDAPGALPAAARDLLAGAGARPIRSVTGGPEDFYYSLLAAQVVGTLNHFGGTIGLEEESGTTSMTLTFRSRQ